MDFSYRSTDKRSSIAHPQRRGMRPWKALGTVRRDEFEAPDYHFVSAPAFKKDAPILDGRVQEAQLQPGLWLHCAEVQDLHNMTSRVPLEPGVRLVMLLAGELDVSIGRHRLLLQADGPNAALVNMRGPELFERRWRKGKWERKLSLHFTLQWLRDHEVLPLSDDAVDGVCVLHWIPSSYSISLAEQLMLDVDSTASGLLRLKQAARALDILCEALGQCEASCNRIAEIPAPRLRDHERMLRVRAFLDEEIAHAHTAALPVTMLGRRFGLSASALQRQFRQAFAMSITEYRRSMRLLQARADLECGISIAEVANRAGYTSAANFSTAFRRHFGLTPSDLRTRA